MFKRNMKKAIFLIMMLLFVPTAKGKEIETTAKADYVQALKTADVFLWAWSNRDANSGVKLISANLLSKLKKENNEDWLSQYMTGLSNPHHLSFEIGRGKEINSKRFTFPVTLFEYYTDGEKAFQYKSNVEVIKEDDSWRVDLLPTTSDNE